MFKTMWPLTKCNNGQSSGSKSKERLSEDLLHEIRSAAPGARLSYILRNNLERLEKAERKEIVSIVSKQDECAPLFIACKKGNLEIVEYLIENCGADVEQKGTYEVVDDKASHRVSPLWCAAVAGRINIVKCLVKHGANVNSVSDTGSTPVRSACFMTHQDIVQFLVEQAGADIQLPNYNGTITLRYESMSRL
jgi:ankyrin repeat protein